MPTLLVIEPDLVGPLGCRVSKRSSILRWKRHIARRLWDRKRATPTGLVTVTRTPSLIGGALWLDAGWEESRAWHGYFGAATNIDVGGRDAHERECLGPVTCRRARNIEG